MPDARRSMSFTDRQRLESASEIFRQLGAPGDHEEAWEKLRRAKELAGQARSGTRLALGAASLSLEQARNALQYVDCYLREIGEL